MSHYIRYNILLYHSFGFYSSYCLDFNGRLITRLGRDDKVDWFFGNSPGVFSSADGNVFSGTSWLSDNEDVFSLIGILNEDEFRWIGLSIGVVTAFVEFFDCFWRVFVMVNYVYKAEVVSGGFTSLGHIIVGVHSQQFQWCAKEMAASVTVGFFWSLIHSWIRWASRSKVSPSNWHIIDSLKHD